MSNMHAKEIVRKLEDAGYQIGQRVGGYRSSAFARFPFLFIGLSTFGFVATLYGFEKIIDSIPFLSDRPLLILALGIAALTLTGTLYQKLK